MIDKIQKTDLLTKNDFFQNHVHNKKPLLVKESEIYKDAITRWSEDYFVKKCGGVIVTLNEFNHVRNQISRKIIKDISLKSAVNLMNKNKLLSRKYYIMRNSIQNHFPQLSSDLDSLPWIQDGYTKFSTDLWFGDGGNITPIHYDNADNFCIPIFGSKTFYLYPPDQLEFIPPNNLISGGRFNFSQVKSRFLGNGKAPLKNVQYIEVYVEPGNLLFIPRGWWHEVLTHDERAASLTCFFNIEPFPNLLYQYLAFQSVRLHEINKLNEVQEILYYSNYDNYLDSALKLVKHNQLWLAMLLVASMLEQLISVSINKSRESLFSLILENPHNKICHNLLNKEKWHSLWQPSISLALMENNDALKKHNIHSIILEIQNFIDENRS
ncbi:MAG: cupin-like domain-containing protein [Alphaproteobacteria bacterium]|nr:cupin-like domain-containing protein [Alphaproteobacteria bacterium]